jgi:toxin ParE1/3/4
VTRLRRSARAEADLLDIWHRIAPNDPEAAEKLLRRIDAVCQELVLHPELGARREDVVAGLRLFPVGRYLILYRRSGPDIEVLRVLHGARQWQDLL